MKKESKIELLIFILIPLFVGFLSGLLSSGFNNYSQLVQPSFAPPGWLFPIVWLILYILMGISSYIIYASNDISKNSALFVYIIQLVVNFFWSIIFFRFKNYLLSLIWIILLLILIIVMIYKFFKINKLSAYLQIPYLIWVSFATILTYSIYMLN